MPTTPGPGRSPLDVLAELAELRAQRYLDVQAALRAARAEGDRNLAAGLVAHRAMLARLLVEDLGPLL